MTHPVTLITGASSGIGAELARVFSAHGHRVALVARRADRLHALAAEIVASGRISPIVIPCDLGEADAADRIAAALTAWSVEVMYLVNNAGYRSARPRRRTGPRRSACDDRPQYPGADGSDVAFRRKRDPAAPACILNVGSIVGFLPGPGMAVYYASKAYVLSFSEALRGELGPRGVRVTVICPGPVPSEFRREQA